MNKNVVCNVFAYFERQAKKARVSSSPLFRTVKATGLSRATVTGIKREQRQLSKGVEFCSTTSAFSCTNSFIAQKCPLVFDITMSCDCHMVIPNDIARIVVALILMYMYWERWLALLPTVYNLEIQIFLLARGEELRG